MKKIIYSLLLTLLIGLKVHAQTPAFYFHVYSSDSNYGVALNQYQNSIDTVEAYIVMDSSTSTFEDTIRYFWAVNDIDFIVTDSMVTTVSTPDSVFTMLDPNVLTIGPGMMSLQRQSVMFQTSQFALGHDLVIVWPRIRDVISANPIIFEIEMHLESGIDEVSDDHINVVFDGSNYVWQTENLGIRALTLMDMSGRIITQTTDPKLPASSLVSGVYIYRIELSNGDWQQGKIHLIH